MSFNLILPSEKDIARFHQGYIAVPETGCWLWHKCIGSGKYGHMSIGKKVLKAHRISYVIHKGNIPEGYDVMHKCDTPMCVNPDHLEAVTTQENVLDCIRKGRGNKAAGERNTKAKLTRDQVLEIMKLDWPTKILAERYGVSMSSIRRVKRGSSWRLLWN